MGKRRGSRKERRGRGRNNGEGQRRKGRKENEMEVEREEEMDPETRLWRSRLQVLLGLGSACPQCPQSSLPLYCPTEQQFRAQVAALSPSLCFHWPSQPCLALCLSCLSLMPFYIQSHKMNSKLATQWGYNKAHVGKPHSLFPSWCEMERNSGENI